MKNFTFDQEPDKHTLVGGGYEAVGTLDLRVGETLAKSAIISIKGVSGVALTDTKLQVRNHEVFDWSDYLEGADWLDLVNYSQRNWTSDQNVSDVAPGETATAQINTLGYAHLRLLVNGTAGTVIETQMQSIEEK